MEGMRGVFELAQRHERSPCLVRPQIPRQRDTGCFGIGFRCQQLALELQGGHPRLRDINLADIAHAQSLLIRGHQIIQRMGGAAICSRVFWAARASTNAVAASARQIVQEALQRSRGRPQIVIGHQPAGLPLAAQLDGLSEAHAECRWQTLAAVVRDVTPPVKAETRVGETCAAATAASASETL